MPNFELRSKTTACFCCGNADLERTSLGEELLDSSDFLEQSQVPQKNHYDLTVCRDCGHVEIKSDNPCWLSTRKHTFITYNEPTDYFPLIANLIRSIELDPSETSLHTFSYKDLNLIDYLQVELGIVDVKKNDHAQTSESWQPTINDLGELSAPAALGNFLDEIEQCQKKNKVILITRFLDHANNIELVEAVLNLCSKSVHLVFDINDYEQLFNSNTLEFIWNERRNLFVRHEIEQLVINCGTRSAMFAYESQTTSPTIFGLISNRIDQHIGLTSNRNLELPRSNVGTRLQNLRQKWMATLPIGSKLGVIGASHKGISLAQFVLDKNVQYSLHDDKNALAGKIPPVLPPLGFHRVSDFNFSSYSHITITTTKLIAAKIIPQVRASGFKGKILDFDCRILN